MLYDFIAEQVGQNYVDWDCKTNNFLFDILSSLSSRRFFLDVCLSAWFDLNLYAMFEMK